MRIVLVVSITVIVFSAAPAVGQSWFTFRNQEVGVDAPVYDAAGVPLAGPTFLAELWGADTTNGLSPLVLLVGNNRLIKPFTQDGYVAPADGGYLVVPSVAPNGWAWLQMRAWDSRLGATYDEVVARGMGGYGQSAIFYAQGSDPFDFLALPGTLIGLQSFSLRSVPEPTSTALLSVGGMLWLFLSRRRARIDRREE